MTRTFRDYLAESEQWADVPRSGDEIDLEIAPDEVVEGWVLESDGETIVIEADDHIMAVLQNRGMISERIARYGAVASNRGQGFTVSEDQDSADDQDAQHAQENFLHRMIELAGCARTMAETETDTSDPLADKAASLAPVGAQGSQSTVRTMDEGVMSEIDIDLQSLANRGDEEDLIAALEGDLGPGTAMVLQNMMEELKDELAAKGMTDVIRDYDKMIEILWDKIVDEYSVRDLDEAEYQGRKVQLGKPMQGDVKKFKVYVKDPKTGNVKKVNFGDKTMRIKKSNPARRRSFRARHNCDNPGPRTKARYWSCRKW